MVTELRNKGLHKDENFCFSLSLSQTPEDQVTSICDFSYKAG